MSQDLEKRVLDLEIKDALSGLKWTALWVMIAIWFIILNVIATNWLLLGVWAFLGGLHLVSGVEKWKTYKALREKKEE